MRKNRSQLYNSGLVRNLGICGLPGGKSWQCWSQLVHVFHAKRSGAAGSCSLTSLFHTPLVRLSTSEEETRLFHACKIGVGVACSVLTPGAAADMVFFVLLCSGHPSLPSGSINKLRLLRGTLEMLHTLSSLARQTTSRQKKKKKKDWTAAFWSWKMNLLLFILPPLCPQSRYLIVTRMGRM